MYFKINKFELEQLAKKDPILGEYLRKKGLIKRAVIDDLYQALIFQIINQQISLKAANTIYQKFIQVTNFDLLKIQALDQDQAKQIGLSLNKRNCIIELTKKILAQEIKLENFKNQSDQEISEQLKQIKGIGNWTIEMFLIFGLQRKNIISYHDLGIRKAMIKLYHLEKLDQKTFLNLKANYEPYATIATLYLWELNNEKN